MPDTILQADSPLPLSAGFEEGKTPVEKKGLMLPPPIPSKEAKSDNNGVPGPPPRMTRLPSLKQLSDHLHYTPSSSSTAQFANNVLSTPGQSPSSSSIPATPPSLRIATGSALPQGTPGSVAQSPLIAPSPSSRLRLPASAMMRSLSSGSNGNGPTIGTPLETLHSPNWMSRTMSSGNTSGSPLDLFGNPTSTGSEVLKDSPISATIPNSITGTPQSTTTPNGSVLPGRESAPPMSRSSSTNSYIQGYSNVPSLDQIRRRISISQMKNPSLATISNDSPALPLNSEVTATIATTTTSSYTAPPAEKSPSTTITTSETPTTAKDATSTKTEKQVESPPHSASLTASSSSSAENELINGKKKKEHPLRFAWTLFFDSKTYKPDPTSLPKKEGEKALTDYEMTLLTVGKFDTVEGFARHLNNIRLPSLLNKNSNYHMFKNGIRPMWEDPSNANGGKWVILFRNSPSTLDVAWANLTMALVGEILDDEDEVCGIVSSNRPKIDRIQIWTRSRDDHDKLNKLGRKILEIMNLDGRDRESMSMEYQYSATNSHPPSGLFLHIPFPAAPTRSTSSLSSTTTTPNRLSVSGQQQNPVGLGISSSSTLSPRLGNGSLLKSPTNNSFGIGTGKLEPPTLSTSLSQRRLSGGAMAGANAFAGPMGGMGMGRIGSSGGSNGGTPGGLGSNLSRSSSPSINISPSPSPTPRALKG
ncbi:uncharacterized protein L201_005954 [Kwoniella dendrophila CBS 6074]|uniref:Translation initiation factor 4E n=1 Tax=Kwoniella dendrophila CBS 6074 TaxID=1295534 RepID=A0AAX4K1M2_9TREE